MGYIYKIENSINGKIYIGQTIKAPEKRFQQHRNNYTKPYFSQLVLYKAFRKYGLDNFIFSVIEEVPNELLDEREIYWISYYNSYNDGYNSTLGGRTVTLYNWDIDEIIALYQQIQSARKVAKIIGCDHSTIDHLLLANHVERYEQNEANGKMVIIQKDDIVQTFNSINNAAEWIIQQEQLPYKISCVAAKISENARKNKSYHGYNITIKSKI